MYGIFSHLWRFLFLMVNAGTVNIPYMDPMGYVKPFKLRFQKGIGTGEPGQGPLSCALVSFFLNHENCIEKKVVYVSQLAYYTLDI